MASNQETDSTSYLYMNYLNVLIAKDSFDLEVLFKYKKFQVVKGAAASHSNMSGVPRVWFQSLPLNET